MFINFLLFLILLAEIGFAAALVLGFLKLSKINKILPLILRHYLSQLVQARTNLEDLNLRLTRPPVKPFKPYELGSFIGNLAIQLLIFKKRGIVPVLVTIINNKDRIESTVIKYKESP